MTSLTHRQQKIQEKRKQTSFRDFLMEIASSYNLMFYRNQGLISRFPESERCGPLHSPQEYIDKFGDGTPGVDYDSTISFFENLQKFFRQTPKMAQIHYGVNEGCHYAETVFGAKNAYLSVCIGQKAENILYSTMVYENCFNIFNSVLTTSSCENIYYCKLVTNSFNIFYSKYIHNSNNIRFSSNLVGCSECIQCDGLENQSYCIANTQLSKELYFKQKSKILSQKSQFQDFLEKVNSLALNKMATNATGSGVQFCDSIENGYLVSRFQNCRNIAFSDGTPVSNNVIDCFDIGHCDDTIAWMGCGQSCSQMYCGANASQCNNVYYSYFLGNCSFCLGCIGLKNKSYCILNKQYNKEERYTKVNEIFTQMETEGILGQFFPATMNPFYFNDTAAFLIDPSFTKEEVTAKGYLWRDEPIKVDIPAGATVVSIKDLDQYEGRMVGTQFFASSTMDGKNSIPTDASWYIDPAILNVIIQDESGNVYRIVKMEYDFLMKHGLPLPRKHRLERMKENFRIQ